MEANKQKQTNKNLVAKEFNTEPNWEGKCENCGETPTVTDIGLCGPCCWGEAETVGGNW